MRRVSLVIRWGVFLAVLLGASRPARARTWVIQEDGTGDAPTIQSGIDSSAVGDTVLVGPGTYLEHPDFLGKDIVLKSAMGPEVTILDGSLGEELWGVGIRNGESRDAVLEGFLITNGTVGINVRDSEPTIIGNIIDGNSGPGIVGDASDGFSVFRPLLCGNVIRNNVAKINGGGVYIAPGLAPQIIDNVITGNVATAGDGGGIFAYVTPRGMVISGNHIEGNLAGDHGGGIYVVWGNVGPSGLEISWNVIRDNKANGIGGADFEGGGGIYLYSTNAWVHHNTIVENSGALDAGASGGGIALSDEENPTIEQNIIAYSPTGKAIACFNSTAPVIRNNLAWMNRPEDIGGICEPFWVGNGNIVADPDFCDLANGDLSLGINSPALRHPVGPLGAISAPGCRGMVPVVPTTWGKLKSMFRR